MIEYPLSEIFFQLLCSPRSHLNALRVQTNSNAVFSLLARSVIPRRRKVHPDIIKHSYITNTRLQPLDRPSSQHTGASGTFANPNVFLAFLFSLPPAANTSVSHANACRRTNTLTPRPAGITLSPFSQSSLQFSDSPFQCFIFSLHVIKFVSMISSLFIPPCSLHTCDTITPKSFLRR
jgi:hypothetical protein